MRRGAEAVLRMDRRGAGAAGRLGGVAAGAAVAGAAAAGAGAAGAGARRPGAAAGRAAAAGGPAAAGRAAAAVTGPTRGVLAAAGVGTLAAMRARGRRSVAPRGIQWNLIDDPRRAASVRIGSLNPSHG